MDDSAAEAPQDVNRRTRLIRGLRLVFIVLVGVWLVWALVSSPSNLKDLSSLWGLPGAWLFLFGWMAIPIGLWLLWRCQLQLMTGRQLSFSESLAIQSVAWAGRYMPGKAGLWLAKTALARIPGVGWRALSVSVLAEQLLFLIAGAFIALIVIFSLDPAVLAKISEPLAHAMQTISTHPVIVIIFLSLTVLAAFWGFPRLIAHGAGEGTARFSWYQWPLLLIAHAGIHFIAGVSLYPLISSLLPEAAAALGPFGIAGALALANVAGIAAFFAPAGLGVREAVLAITLTVGVDYDQALPVAVLVRVVTLFSDAVFSVGAWIIGKLGER